MSSEVHATKSISDRYLSLDAMRGVAAMLVVVGHFNGSYAPSAHLAVDFFYLLSGFVIAEAYTRRLEAGLGWIGFLKQRLLRLYPLYLVGLLLGLAQIAVLMKTQDLTINIGELGLSAAANLFILPSPVYFLVERQPGEIFGLFPTNGPAWSIFWEFVINIAFAVFLFRARLRTVCFIAALGFIGMVYGALKFGSLNIGWEWPSFEGGLARVVFAFNIGIVLSRLRILLPRVKSFLALAPAFVLAGFMLLSPPGEVRVLYELSFCLIAAPLIVACGIMVEVPAYLSKICFYAGYISYPVYILHRGVLKIAELGVEKLHIPSTIGIVLILAGLCIFAYFTSILTERVTKAIYSSRLKAAA